MTRPHPSQERREREPSPSRLSLTFDAPSRGHYFFWKFSVEVPPSVPLFSHLSLPLTKPLTLSPTISFSLYLTISLSLRTSTASRNHPAPTVVLPHALYNELQTTTMGGKPAPQPPRCSQRQGKPHMGRPWQSNDKTLFPATPTSSSRYQSIECIN